MTTTELIETHCTFCQREIHMRCDAEGLQSYPGLRKWADKIACERCATYKREIRKLRGSITRECMKVTAARLYGVKNLPEIEKRIRQRLVVLTRKFADIVCTHKHKPLAWEPDFADQLVRKPDRSHAILDFYEGHV